MAGWLVLFLMDSAVQWQVLDGFAWNGKPKMGSFVGVGAALTSFSADPSRQRSLGSMVYLHILFKFQG